MSETIIKQYLEDGICYPQITINIRNKPCSTTGVILDQYYSGESVIYDSVTITNNYVWISWISGGGRRVYMTVKNQVTGERWGQCADIPTGTGGSGYGEFLNLHPHMQSWSVYNQNGPYTSANAIGKLAPAQFGGLSYAILDSKGGDIYLIETESFGRCAIWAPRDNDSSITPSPKYSNSGPSGTPGGLETITSEYPESGICYPQMTINIRNKPCATTGTVIDQYYVGESVIYDYVVITNKYVWISYISSSGIRRYMTVKDQVTGERWGQCADVPSGGSGMHGGSGSYGGLTEVKKVFIDPGHGGSDPGACGNGLAEKDITLSIAFKLGAKLNAKGFEVRYSRISDTYVDFNRERARLANEWGADLFISIHANALDGSGRAYGTEVYTHPNDTYATKQLAADVCDSISNKLGTYNRGHKNADYAVLRGTTMPAVLVETAFIDNASDANLLRNRQDDFATAICNVIAGTNPASSGPSESNGLEYIVVSGYEADIDRFKYNFIETALKKLHEYKRMIEIGTLPKNSKITWLIDTTSYSATQYANFLETVNQRRLPVDVKEFNSLTTFIKYMNTGSIIGTSTRRYLIKEFTYFGHGHQNLLDFGNNYVFNRTDIGSLDNRMFHSKFHSVFYSCNTATGGNLSFAYLWHTDLAAVKTQACLFKTDYANIAGDTYAERFLFDNTRGSNGYCDGGSANYPVPDLQDPNAKWIIYL